MNINSKEMKETLSFLNGKIGPVPEVLIILGSGLTKMVESVEVKTDIPYEDVPFFKKTNAYTHKGHIIAGKLGNNNVLIMQGRYHVYEGYDAGFTAFPVKVAAELGVKKLITTNLSGAINGSFKIGDFMVVEDHLNLSGVNPLIWNSEKDSAKYTDMYQAYSPKLIARLEKAALELNIGLHKGVLAYLTGPNFETRAELRMLKLLGADAVGWSMVPEVLEARRSGMEVLAIACISDISDPERFGAVNLEKIYHTAAKRAGALLSLLSLFIKKS